jgi:hypothetical protein
LQLIMDSMRAPVTREICQHDGTDWRDGGGTAAKGKTSAPTPAPAPQPRRALATPAVPAANHSGGCGQGGCVDGVNAPKFLLRDIQVLGASSGSILAVAKRVLSADDGVSSAPSAVAAGAAPAAAGQAGGVAGAGGAGAGGMSGGTGNGSSPFTAANLTNATSLTALIRTQADLTATFGISGRLPVMSLNMYLRKGTQKAKAGNFALNGGNGTEGDLLIAQLRVQPLRLGRAATDAAGECSPLAFVSKDRPCADRLPPNTNLGNSTKGVTRQDAFVDSVVLVTVVNGAQALERCFVMLRHARGRRHSTSLGATPCHSTSLESPP